MEAVWSPFFVPEWGGFRGGRTTGQTKWTDKIYELDGQNMVFGCRIERG